MSDKNSSVCASYLFSASVILRLPYANGLQFPVSSCCSKTASRPSIDASVDIQNGFSKSAYASSICLHTSLFSIWNELFSVIPHFYRSSSLFLFSERFALCLSSPSADLIGGLPTGIKRDLFPQVWLTYSKIGRIELANGSTRETW